MQLFEEGMKKRIKPYSIPDVWEMGKSLINHRKYINNQARMFALYSIGP